ncbi:MAG: type IV pilus secretin PilQ [Desulfobacteraceae bacterium]|nr:type IV pilus secretin PilQ [Desulfobacteraceae bacterium]
MLHATTHGRSKRSIFWLILAILLHILMFGCASKEPSKKEVFFEQWKYMAKESKGYSPSRKVRSFDIQEEARAKGAAPAKEEKPAPIKPLPTQKVTLKMHEADVPVLLRALARLADQNIMINAGVKGKLSMNVKGVPWDQVFKGILRTQGLTYSWEGDIIRVISLTDMERDLKIEAIQEKRKAQEMGMRRVQPLLTAVVHVDYADATKLKENLQEFLTKDKEGKPRGVITVNEHTNSLVIQAIRDDIVKLMPLMEELDRPTPQILIEANIVETTRETARELGIQWGGLYHHGKYWITPGANSAGAMEQPLSTGIDPSTGMAANFPAVLTEGAGLTLGVLKESIGKYLLNVQLSALEDEGKLNILSRPSITTLDNRKAVIESGAEIPFQTVTGTGTSKDVKTEWKEATLRLEVTPHVIGGQMLKMKIHTTKNEPDFTRTVQGNPTIIKKEAETNLILYDGETTVIGGLTKETNSGSESGIPGLKDIPGLGYLFKGEGKSNKMEEVLIFITPHILKEKFAGEESQPQKQTGGEPPPKK